MFWFWFDQSNAPRWFLSETPSPSSSKCLLRVRLSSCRSPKLVFLSPHPHCQALPNPPSPLCLEVRLWLAVRLRLVVLIMLDVARVAESMDSLSMLFPLSYFMTLKIHILIATVPSLDYAQCEALQNWGGWRVINSISYALRALLSHLDNPQLLLTQFKTLFLPFTRTPSNYQASLPQLVTLSPKSSE